MQNERYSGNLGAFTAEELERIREKSICIIGCGGLGGYAANAVARFGVARLTLVDGDVFCRSNLNRQLFATECTIGKNKARETARIIKEINSSLTVNAVNEMLSELNAEQIIKGHDLVLDCLDSVSARLNLESACTRLNTPLIHGAIDGFYGQMAVVMPGSGVLKRLYGKQSEKPVSSPVFTVQAVAAIQCSEAIKLLCGKESSLTGKLMHINLKENTFTTVTV